MTLTTHLIIKAPVPLEALWTELLGDVLLESTGFDGYARWNETVCDPDIWPERVHEFERRTVTGQGLAALLSIRWNPDGPLAPSPFFDSEPDPAGMIEVTWDSTWGGTNFATGLHRRLTGSIGQWLDDRNVGWAALDEYTQCWHDRTPVPA